jgi:hypothetical protein
MFCSCLLNTLKPESNLNNSYKFSPYRKENKRVSITKISCLMLCTEENAVCSKNHTNPINTLCGQNAGTLIVKAGGTYSYHWALKD